MYFFLGLFDNVGRILELVDTVPIIGFLGSWGSFRSGLELDLKSPLIWGKLDGWVKLSDMPLRAH